MHGVTAERSIRQVTAGLAESKYGSLPPYGWLKVTCGLTAYTLGSALGPTLGNEYRYGKTLHFYRATAMLNAVYAVVVCLSVCLCVCHTPVLYQNG